MAPLKVVAIAASAGGLDALEEIVSALPRGFPAAVLIVLHVQPAAGSAIPEILGRVGHLPACLAHNGERLGPGRIYVAPANRHMIVDGKKIRLTATPKENFVRPAADPLFRSIAREFGSRAIGVVLSGSGRDGAEGLAAIKGAGGTAIVQDPKDAPFPAMPLSALAVRLPDHCVPARAVASIVKRLVRPESAASVTPRASLMGLSVLVLEGGGDGLALTPTLRRLGCLVMGPVSTLIGALDVVRRASDELDCAVLDLDLTGVTVYPLVAAMRARGLPLLFAARAATKISEAWLWVPRLAKPFDDADLKAVLQATLSGSKAVPVPPSLGPSSGIRYAWETAEESRTKRETATPVAHAADIERD